MIIDVNASLGHYPFRPLQSTTATGLVERMDEHGIDMAIVSSLHAVFYRDSHRGNQELLEEIARHVDRLVPLAVVNPRYVGWERDLDESIEQGRVKGVALFPEHHGYQLSDGAGRAALELISASQVPVVLTQRLEDRRQRHHWDVAEDLSMDSLVEAATTFPQLRFCLSNWIGLDAQKLLAAGLRGRCLIDFARLHVVMNKEVPRLIEALQVESIAFGTHMPFDYPGPSLVKLANLAGLFPEDYEQVAWKNAAQFFGLDLPTNRSDPAGEPR